MQHKEKVLTIIAALREHSPDVLDETGECKVCNKMIELAKSIGEFP